MATIVGLDTLIVEFDKVLRTLFVSIPSTRAVPAQSSPEPALSSDDKAHAGALMRVNHVGEVCAQALYQGQAITCRDPEVRRALEKASCEEAEHLAWTAQRISELGGRRSVLNPLWYLGSFSMGVIAGKCGDAWSLGFLAETERQVEAHLDHHLSELPKQDVKSRAILQQMKIDEASHADAALFLGARDLPTPVKGLMRLVAGVMTRTAYYL